jgi:hypothetical protein
MYQGTVGRLDMLDHSECWQVRNFASLLAEALTLRFNYEGFAMDIKLIAKPSRPLSSPPQAAVLMAG